MIVTDRAALADFAALHPAFGPAARFLSGSGPDALAVGRHDLGPFQAVVVEGEHRGRSGAVLERHARAIDVHCPLRGSEVVGWRPVDTLTRPRGPFDAVRDVGKYDDEPYSWFDVPLGALCVCLPADGHAPLAGSGPFRKIVLKIPLE